MEMFGSFTALKKLPLNFKKEDDMSNKYKWLDHSYFDCLHFEWAGTEFEVRVTNEVDDIPDGKLRLEVWTVAYDEDDECIGFGEHVKEKILMDGLTILKKETEDE